MASILRDEPDLTKGPGAGAPAAETMPGEGSAEAPASHRRRDGAARRSRRPASTRLPAARRPSPERSQTQAVARGRRSAASILVLAAPHSSSGRRGDRRRARGRPCGSRSRETEKMKFFYGGAMAVSPDGRWMVFPATGEDGVARYWIRSLDTVEARPLPGTETAYVPAAWSGDSRHVFFTVSEQLATKESGHSGWAAANACGFEGEHQRRLREREWRCAGCIVGGESACVPRPSRRRDSGPGHRPGQRGKRPQIPPVPARWPALPVLPRLGRPKPEGRLRGLNRRQTGRTELNASACGKPAGVLLAVARGRGWVSDLPA